MGSPGLLGQPAFRAAETKVPVPPEEAPACNVVAVGRSVVMAAGCPRTAAAIAALGLDVIEVDLSEFTKADGGPTCLSLLA